MSMANVMSSDIIYKYIYIYEKIRKKCVCINDKVSHKYKICCLIVKINI